MHTQNVINNTVANTVIRDNIKKAHAKLPNSILPVNKVHIENNNVVILAKKHIKNYLIMCLSKKKDLIRCI